MVEFKRDKETGVLYVYKDGKRTGRIITMGDEIKDDGKGREKPSEQPK